MKGRTVILVSHHVQLCAPGAGYIVALDNGRVQFEGTKDKFFASPVMKTLVQTTDAAEKDDKEDKEVIEEIQDKLYGSPDSTAITAPAPSVETKERKPARKLVEEEARAVGRISRDIWETYIWACGSGWYWGLFILFLVVASLSPVLENGWLR